MIKEYIYYEVDYFFFTKTLILTLLITLQVTIKFFKNKVNFYVQKEGKFIVIEKLVTAIESYYFKSSELIIITLIFINSFNIINLILLIY
jgi:hypothetical protein